MAQRIKCLTCKYEDMRPEPQNPQEKQAGMLAYNPHPCLGGGDTGSQRQPDQLQRLKLVTPSSAGDPASVK